MMNAPARAYLILYAQHVSDSQTHTVCCALMPNRGMHNLLFTFTFTFAQTQTAFNKSTASKMRSFKAKVIANQLDTTLIYVVSSN